jgi:hypothetical protein
MPSLKLARANIRPDPCYNPAMPFNHDHALTEIEQRNRLRKSASLPLLDIEGELKLEGGGRCL